MYVYCGEDNIEYLVDTETEKVYELTFDEKDEVVSCFDCDGTCCAFVCGD